MRSFLPISALRNQSSGSMYPHEYVQPMLARRDEQPAVSDVPLHISQFEVVSVVERSEKRIVVVANNTLDNKVYDIHQFSVSAIETVDELISILSGLDALMLPVYSGQIEVIAEEDEDYVSHNVSDEKQACATASATDGKQIVEDLVKIEKLNTHINKILERTRALLLQNEDQDIVPAIGIWTDENFIYLLKVHVPTFPLRLMITELGGKVSEQFVKIFTARCLLMLSNLHERIGCAHRNFNPESIGVKPSGDILLTKIDYPSYLFLDIRTNGLHTERRLTRNFTARNYLAPELGVSDEKYCQAVDLWSLGVMIVEFLLGHNPFAADPSEDTGANIKSYPQVLDMIEKKNVMSAAGMRVLRQLLAADDDRCELARPLLVFDWFDGIDLSNLAVPQDNVMISTFETHYSGSAPYYKWIQKALQQNAKQLIRTTLSCLWDFTPVPHAQLQFSLAKAALSIIRSLVGPYHAYYFKNKSLCSDPSQNPSVPPSAKQDDKNVLDADSRPTVVVIPMKDSYEYKAYYGIPNDIIEASVQEGEVNHNAFCIIGQFGYEDLIGCLIPVAGSTCISYSTPIRASVTPRIENQYCIDPSPPIRNCSNPCSVIAEPALPMGYRNHILPKFTDRGSDFSALQDGPRYYYPQAYHEQVTPHRDILLGHPGVMRIRCLRTDPQLNDGPHADVIWDMCQNNTGEENSYNNTIQDPKEQTCLNQTVAKTVANAKDAISSVVNSALSQLTPSRLLETGVQAFASLTSTAETRKIIPRQIQNDRATTMVKHHAGSMKRNIAASATRHIQNNHDHATQTRPGVTTYANHVSRHRKSRSRQVEMNSMVIEGSKPTRTYRLPMPFHNDQKSSNSSPLSVIVHHASNGTFVVSSISHSSREISSPSGNYEATELCTNYAFHVSPDGIDFSVPIHNDSNSNYANTSDDPRANRQLSLSREQTDLVRRLTSTPHGLLVEGLGFLVRASHDITNHGVAGFSVNRPPFPAIIRNATQDWLRNGANILARSVDEHTCIIDGSKVESRSSDENVPESMLYQDDSTPINSRTRISHKTEDLPNSKTSILYNGAKTAINNLGFNNPNEHIAPTHNDQGEGQSSKCTSGKFKRVIRASELQSIQPEQPEAVQGGHWNRLHAPLGNSSQHPARQDIQATHNDGDNQNTVNSGISQVSMQVSSLLGPTNIENSIDIPHMTVDCSSAKLSERTASVEIPVGTSCALDNQSRSLVLYYVYLYNCIRTVNEILLRIVWPDANDYIISNWRLEFHNQVTTNILSDWNVMRIYNPFCLDLYTGEFNFNYPNNSNSPLDDRVMATYQLGLALLPHDAKCYVLRAMGYNSNYPNTDYVKAHYPKDNQPVFWPGEAISDVPTEPDVYIKFKQLPPLQILKTINFRSLGQFLNEPLMPLGWLRLPSQCVLNIENCTDLVPHESIFDDPAIGFTACHPTPDTMASKELKIIRSPNYQPFLATWEDNLPLPPPPQQRSRSSPTSRSRTPLYYPPTRACYPAHGSGLHNGQDAHDYQHANSHMIPAQAHPQSQGIPCKLLEPPYARPMYVDHGLYAPLNPYQCGYYHTIQHCTPTHDRIQQKTYYPHYVHERNSVQAQPLGTRATNRAYPAYSQDDL